MTHAPTAQLADRLIHFAQSNETLAVLTGAGVSAASGIPTFRGEGGYWHKDSAVYKAEDIATPETFAKDPELVWAWYLYRRSICHRAEPNAGHQALVELEQLLGDRFTLVTQNVDGLHRRAGNERLYEVHGNIDYCRQDGQVLPMPDLPLKAKDTDLTDTERQALKGKRPHILWFGEQYDEDLYQAGTAFETFQHADLVLVAGTSGAISMIQFVIAKTRGTVIEINTEASLIAELADYRLSGSSTQWLPWLVEQVSLGMM